jgi:hypothetical protein
MLLYKTTKGGWERPKALLCEISGYKKFDQVSQRNGIICKRIHMSARKHPVEAAGFRIIPRAL